MLSRSYSVLSTQSSALVYPSFLTTVMLLTNEGGVGMQLPSRARRTAPGLTRRELLQAGLAAGVTLSIQPLTPPPSLWGGETAQPKRGGILHVRGRDPCTSIPISRATTGRIPR